MPRPRSLLSSLLVVAAVSIGAGCGSADEGPAAGDDVTVDLAAGEYYFRADAAADLRAGDRVTFVVRNEGELDHRLEVLSAESRSLGATDRIPPDARGEVTVTFEESGVYRVICDIDDHLTRGQQAAFEVGERSAEG